MKYNFIHLIDGEKTWQSLNVIKGEQNGGKIIVENNWKKKMTK